MILSLPPDGKKQWSLLSALSAFQEFSSYLQLKRTHKMVHSFTAPISGSYSMVRSSRLIQSCQLPLGTALREDLRGACGCQPIPWSPVGSEEEEAGAGTPLGRRRGWCWGRPRWPAEAHLLSQDPELVPWASQGQGQPHPGQRGVVRLR